MTEIIKKRTELLVKFIWWVCFFLFGSKIFVVFFFIFLGMSFYYVICDVYIESEFDFFLVVQNSLFSQQIEAVKTKSIILFRSLYRSIPEVYMNLS